MYELLHPMKAATELTCIDPCYYNKLLFRKTLRTWNVHVQSAEWDTCYAICEGSNQCNGEVNKELNVYYSLLQLLVWWQKPENKEQDGKPEEKIVNEDNDPGNILPLIPSAISDFTQ